MEREKIRSLHSGYNPQAEADRYINSLSLDKRIRFFVLIEPGLGYMIAPLRKKVPGAKIIALYIEPHSTCNNTEENISPPDSEWSPGAEISIHDFLEKEIPEGEAGEIRILEWRPALAIYGQVYLSLVEETANFIKLTDANRRTIGAFGRRWVRNFFRNIDSIWTVFCPEPFSMPLLVTGAGPGLEDAIPLIRKEFSTSGVFILASSSSVMSLESQALFPDMVISTDGGAWAALHLLECFRKKNLSSAKNCIYPIAASLTAVLPSQCGTLPVLPISDGSFWQTLVLKELNIPYIVLPQRGTVSASALDLAFFLSNGDIFIAGMDLSNHDIRSHCRPYSFDRLMEEKSERTNPLYSQTFKRSSLLKTGGSYAIYASWFKNQLSSYPKRLHSLGKNSLVFNSLETASLKKARGRNVPGEIKFKTVSLYSGINRSHNAAGILEKAFKNPVLSKALAKELSELLMPDKEDISSDELIAEIYSLTPGSKLRV